MSTSSAQATPEVCYPESDGKPMGETGIHVNATIELFWTLRRVVFKDRHDVYVASDMFFYYEQGNPRAVKAPDIMVIKGVDDGTIERRTFKLWVENRVPNVIFEITSDETRRDDAVIKLELYARLGVAEYFLFDPLREYLDPALRGYRLEDGRYQAIKFDVERGFQSTELGLNLRVLERRVRLFDPTTGHMVPLPGEGDLEMIEALERGLAEERKARMKEERKVNREKQRATREAKKAEAERQKSVTLEAEVRRLQAILKERGPDDLISPRS